MTITDYVARWKFDENAGTSAADDSGNGNTGALTNAPGWVAPGQIGVSHLSFNGGASQYVAVPHAASLAIAGPITMAAWAMWNGLTIGSFAYILGKANQSGHEQFMMRFIGGSLRVGCWNGADHGVNYALPGGFLNVWHHIAGRYDGTNWKAYVDGVEVASNADAVGALGGTSGALHLGGGNAGGAGRFFSGELDDIRIYSRALDATEIADLFAFTEGGGPPPGQPATKRMGGVRFARAGGGHVW